MSYLPIYKTLNEDVNVTSKISIEDKLFEDFAPLETPPPFIVWQALTGQALNDLDSPANFDTIQVQIMVYSDLALEAYEIKDSIRKAIESKAWVLNPSLNSYDSARKLYARGFDANWILER